MAESFEEFLEHWRKQSLPTVSGRELDTLLEKGGRELSEAAIARGFRSQLTNACKPYRTMSAFVRALYDASHHHRKHNGKDGS